MTHVIRELGRDIHVISADTVQHMTREDFAAIVKTDPQSKSYAVVAMLSAMNPREREIITPYAQPLLDRVTVTNTHARTGWSGAVTITIAQVRPETAGRTADVAFVYHRGIPGKHHLAAVGVAREDVWGKCVTAPTYNGVVACRQDCLTIYDLVSDRTNSMKSFGPDCAQVRIDRVETDPSFMGALVVIGCANGHAHRLLMNYDGTYHQGRIAYKGKPTRPWLRSHAISASCTDTMSDGTITRKYELAIGDPRDCKYIANDIIACSYGGTETRVLHISMQPTYTCVPYHVIGARDGDGAVMDAMAGDKRRHLFVPEVGNRGCNLSGEIQVLALRKLTNTVPGEIRVIFDTPRKHDQGPPRCEKVRQRKYAFLQPMRAAAHDDIEVPAYYVTSAHVYVINYATGRVYARTASDADTCTTCVNTDADACDEHWCACPLPDRYVRGTAAVTYRGFEITRANGATFVWYDPGNSDAVLTKFRPPITGKFVIRKYIA